MIYETLTSELEGGEEGTTEAPTEAPATSETPEAAETDNDEL
jgi:hypothetical protein